jgi:prepilin-type N-terminal cleavage/methylation domain-containing protein
MMNQSKVHPSSLRFAEASKLKVHRTNLRPPILSTFNFQPSTFNPRRAFTLIEVMVVAVMLALIVLAMMAVFNGTQTAFRAGITQVGMQESGRAVIDLIKSDLETMTPSFVPLISTNPVPNFWEASMTTSVQALPASTNSHANVLQDLFFLVRQNQTWTGIGYFVRTNNNGSSPIGLPVNGFGTLYRFKEDQSSQQFEGNPRLLFSDFSSACESTSINSTNTSLLLDGVLDLRIRAFNIQGGLVNTNSMNIFATNYVAGEVGFYAFYSNAVPATVEIQLGLLEDRTLQRAESLPDVAPVWAQSNYLAGHAGQVHVFRQRVWIRNVDPSAYQ